MTVHQVGSPVEGDMFVGDEPKVSLFDALKEAVQRKVNKPPYVLTVPNRPDMSLVFDVNFDFDTFQAWVKRAEDKKSKDREINQIRLSLMVISNQCRGIELNGTQVDHEGEWMTVASPELHEWLKVPRGNTGSAIRALYSADGHVIQACRMIVEKAGYSMDGDVLEADEDGPLGL